MKPNKEGQIVRFCTPYEGENPNQQYVVLELHNGVDVPRVKIQALNTGLPFAPVSVVNLNELEIVETNTSDLIGHVVYIKKEDSTKVLGRITSVNQQAVNLNLSKVDNGVDTNVLVTVVDKDGKEHSGILFVN
jgi:hypothetical protein